MQQKFLDNYAMTQRGEKAIYIRVEYHERIARIVQIIGYDKIALDAYLDNILEHHFKLFEKAITADSMKSTNPIFNF